MTSLHRPFVLDPPRANVERIDGLILPDVDGVLNALNDTVDRNSLPTVSGDSGRSLPINLVANDVLDALHSCLSRTVRIGWLTTWGFRVSRLEEMLGGTTSQRFAGDLLISPDSTVGLTLLDATRVAEHMGAVSGRQVCGSVS